MLNFHIFSIFPESFTGYFETSMLKRFQEEKLIKINYYDIRKFSEDKHRTVDDKPYGGGAGMVMKAEPVIKAVESVLKNKKIKKKDLKIILLSAKGKRFVQKTACDLSKRFKHIFLICGRYEGVDERVKIILSAEEVSIGPYVLTDGDVAAMVIVSAVARLIPGAIRFESLKEESYFNSLLSNEKEGWLEYPHYTRPEILTHPKIRGKKYRVPKVLLAGNHKDIAEWRHKHLKKEVL